jgi:hypothetical protein
VILRRMRGQYQSGSLMKHNVETMVWIPLDQKRHVPMAGSREHNDENLRSITGVESLDLLRDCQILKKESVFTLR